MIAVMVARWVDGARAALTTVLAARLVTARSVTARLVTASAIAALLGAALLPPPAAIGAEPTATAPPVAAQDVSLRLAATPRGTLAPGEPLDLTLVVTNPGDNPLDGGGVQFSMTRHPLTDRAALHDWLESGELHVELRELASATTPPVGTGTSSAPVFARVPAEAVALPAGESSAIYGVTATLEAGAGTVTGRAVFVWNPKPTTTSGVAVVLPITTPTSVNGLIGASELQTFTSPGGILTRLLDGVIGHPDVMLAIDPRIIASIRALGSAVPASAADWLESLDTLPNPSFPLQFGDADVAVQAQSGLTQLLQPTSLEYALQASSFSGTVGTLPETTSPSPSPTSHSTATPTPAPEVPSLESLLAWPYAETAIAWPPSSGLRNGDLQVFDSNGLTNTIVASSATDAARRSATPGAHVRIGDAEVLLSDSGLSAALGAAATATSDVEWGRAMGRLNAELAGLGAESPPASRIVLTTLPRGVWPATSFGLAQTLSTVQGSPWSRPATLASVLASPATERVSLQEATQPEQRIATVQRLIESERSIQQFSSVLVQPELLTGETRARLLSMLGTAWIADPEDWQNAALQAIQQNTETIASVRIVSGNANYNLVANEGSIPVTVTNPLPYAVRVELHANPSNGRLAVEQVSSKTVQPGSRAIVLVPVTAQLGNGRVELSLQLTSETGVPIDGTVVVPVDVNADWEGIGALIVGALLVLLFGFGIVRNILRRRKERALEQEAKPISGLRRDASADARRGRRPATDETPSPPPGEDPHG